MKKNVSKVMRIITEILSFCAHQGATTWTNDVSMQQDKTIITILVKDGDLTNKDAEYLNNQLNIPRQQDMEHTYWGLSSSVSGNKKPHLFLAGIMVDVAEVTVKEEGFSIYLERFR